MDLLFGFGLISGLGMTPWQSGSTGSSSSPLISIVFGRYGFTAQWDLALGANLETELEGLRPGSVGNSYEFNRADCVKERG